MQCPVGALARSIRPPGDLYKAVVEGEVVPERVLPALRVPAVVREAVRDEPVYVRQRQHLLRAAPDRHRRQAYVRVRWLLVAVRLARRPRHFSSLPLWQISQHDRTDNHHIALIVDPVL